MATASAQTPPNAFNKAPKNVDDALKARAMEFYRDHVTGKYRKAEELVAEDSKDGFYAATKPVLDSFRFSEITYSDKYTKAKITVVGKMMMTFLGMAGPQMMDVPFPSYWKLERGKWVWYIFQDPNRMTPFGKANGKMAGSGAVDPAQAFATAPDVATVLSGVKVDKSELLLVKMPGSKGTVSLQNQLQGPVTLALDAKEFPGLVVTLEPKQLKSGEKAVLTIQTDEAKAFPTRVIRILVSPSNQVIDTLVKFQ